ncbi:dihydrolipoamide acyltransferase, partial [Candidatus Heimdallarchaeota archaeon]
GISKRPVVIDEEVEIRECVDLTIMVDHAVVDGAPFTRFIQSLTELVEEGYGLAEFK